MYSFLSPANINWLTFDIRKYFPETEYDEIRQSMPALANQWFRTRARVNEDQFTGGTLALNEAFKKWIFATRQFMPPLPDPNPSYSDNIADPYVRNQHFQTVNNDMIYPAQAFEYNPGKAQYFDKIYEELGDADCCGVPIMDNMHPGTIAGLATEIKRMREGKHNHRQLTNVIRTCEDTSRACECPARPRKKFTLVSRYGEGGPDLYNFEQRVGPENMKASQLVEESRWYPNFRYPRKDIIPTKKYYGPMMHSRY